MTEAQARTLLRRHGVVPQALRCVARLDCEVWRVRPRRGTDLALRIYPPHRQDAAAIDTELDWLDALAAEGLHVPAPQRCRDGERLHRLGDGRFAVVLRWLGGRQHDRGLTPARLHAVGRFTGAAHRVAAALQAAGRVRLTREACPIDLARWAAGTHPQGGRLPAGHLALLREAAARLQQEMGAFGHADRGLIHGDLHPWNLLFVRGAAGAIDFSDCGWGPRTMDLAATLQYLRHPLAGNHDHRPQYAALRDALFEGYAAESALPHEAAHRAEVLLTARLFLTLEWMLEDWPTLDHRAWGRGFLRGSQQALRAWLGGRVGA